MSLSVNDYTDLDPTIDLNLPDALTPQNIDRETQPQANFNQTNGSTVTDALNGVLNLLDNGFKVYQNISDKIGTSKVEKQIQKAQLATVSAAQQPSVNVLGLSTNQLLLIAVGLAAIIVLPRLMKA